MRVAQGGACDTRGQWQPHNGHAPIPCVCPASHAALPALLPHSCSRPTMAAAGSARSSRAITASRSYSSAGRPAWLQGRGGQRRWGSRRVAQTRLEGEQQLARHSTQAPQARHQQRPTPASPLSMRAPPLTRNAPADPTRLLHTHTHTTHLICSSSCARVSSSRYVSTAPPRWRSDR